jgi:hypothetical protein
MTEPNTPPPSAPEPLAPLPPPPPPAEVAVLQKLSSPPFPRSGFPLLGIMASVYEHVTDVVSKMRKTEG